MAGGIAVAAVISTAIVALFAPWAFFLGGTFHLMPMWQGVGEATTATGTRYVIWIRMFPTSRGSKTGGTFVRGSAALCSSAGDRFDLRLTGGTSENVWWNMDGRPMSLSLDHPQSRSFIADDYEKARPRLTLRGRWSFPDLAMDDRGSLANAFMPDGHLDARAAGDTGRSADSLPITFKAATKVEFDTECRAIVHA